MKLFANVDSVRSNIRPEARIQGVITEGGAAPNVVPDKTQADFYIRYPDAVYLAQITQWVDEAARAAALATGTKVVIEHYGHDRDGISVAALGELDFAYMKQFGTTGVIAEPQKPQGFEETGSVSSDIPGIGVTAKSSNYSNHTYGMLADAVTEIGHHGFGIDAETEAAILYDFAAHSELRDAVHTEFTKTQALFQQYQGELQKAYPLPQVAAPGQK